MMTIDLEQGRGSVVGCENKAQVVCGLELDVSARTSTAGLICEPLRGFMGMMVASRAMSTRGGFRMNMMTCCILPTSEFRTIELR